MSNILRAEVKWIDPLDFKSVPPREAAEIPELWDYFGWFTVCIGVEGEEAGNNFQVCLATHAAVGRASPRGGFRGVIVDSFEPKEIRRKLHEYVSAITGPTWQHIVDQLRQVMHWEYEGMGGA